MKRWYARREEGMEQSPEESNSCYSISQCVTYNMYSYHLNESGLKQRGSLISCNTKYGGGATRVYADSATSLENWALYICHASLSVWIEESLVAARWLLHL